MGRCERLGWRQALRVVVLAWVGYVLWRYVPAALLPIGYPAETSQPSERHDLRKPLGEIVEFWCESKAKSK